MSSGIISVWKTLCGKQTLLCLIWHSLTWKHRKQIYVAGTNIQRLTDKTFLLGTMKCLTIFCSSHPKVGQEVLLRRALQWASLKKKLLKDHAWSNIESESIRKSSMSCDVKFCGCYIYYSFPINRSEEIVALKLECVANLNVISQRAVGSSYLLLLGD